MYEPTGDDINPNTRALDVQMCLWDVLNKYYAELVVSSSWWMKEMIKVFTTSHAVKSLPS